MPVHAVRLAGGIEISDDPARIDMGFVHDALAATYWAGDRDPAQTERACAHCLSLGVYAPDGGQLGFVRLVTDRTFRAHIADLVIARDARGRGLGHALIETMLAHPELETVTHWTLTTADAQTLYRRYGFREAGTGGTWMTMERAVGDDAGPGGPDILERSSR